MIARFDAQVLVLAKAPRAGQVKTRLCPPYSPEQAAQLAAAALADTLGVVASAPAARHLLVLEGDAGEGVVPPPFGVIGQRGEGLDERLAAAFDDGYRHAALPQLLLGMDTPQVSRPLLIEALATLTEPRCDAVIGPTMDGGYWCLGLARPDSRALLGVPMSTTHTYDAQCERLARRGLRTRVLPLLRDVDTAPDAWAVAREVPHTTFAQVLRSLPYGMSQDLLRTTPQRAEAVS